MTVQTIQEMLNEAAENLRVSATAKLDAELLLAHVLQQPRTYLYTHQDVEVASAAATQFDALVARRAQGEPVAYITGKRAFWDLELEVTPAVLVPRPETELLVEAALDLIAKDSAAYVADLGTGSGAIAIALANSRPAWNIIAIDSSAEALAVAKANAYKHNVANLEFRQASWCDDLAPGALDLIVANPPYVAPGDPHLQDMSLSFEPLSALQAGQAGYADLFAIATGARDHLKPGAWLLLEHGYDQHEELSEKLQALGYIQVAGRKDLAGHWRMMQAQMPAAD